MLILGCSRLVPFQRLTLKYDGPLSNFDFNIINVRRYTEAALRQSNIGSSSSVADAVIDVGSGDARLRYPTSTKHALANTAAAVATAAAAATADPTAAAATPAAALAGTPVAHGDGGGDGAQLGARRQGGAVVAFPQGASGDVSPNVRGAWVKKQTPWWRWVITQGWVDQDSNESVVGLSQSCLPHHPPR
jgi:hypothetical protein